MSAQNQHYVPRFILRHFLANEEKEQVAVYDKQDDRIFITSIKNIMAERRFHDFSFENWMVSYENVVSQIENGILPTYNRVVTDRKLQNTPEEKAALAFLIAFQFVRTKAHRDLAQAFEEEFGKKLESMGHRLEDLEGWKPSTEDDKKRDHLRDMQKSIRDYGAIIATKDFVLANASGGRSFYLGDSPVCLSNQRDFGPYGNIGLALPGIEIYLPLTADLMLCAWCPSIIDDLRKMLKAAKAGHQREILGEVMAGRIPAAKMKDFLAEMAPHYARFEEPIVALNSGAPVSSSAENMDYYNSLQMRYAGRYVVSRDSDFDLARRHNKEFPHLRKGFRPTLS